MSTDLRAVEKHVRYATNCDTLPDAWAFVMEHVDEFKSPSIDINPFWRYSDDPDGDDGTRYFSVVVSGLIDD